ncbi:MAG: tRNA-binding protein [Bacteroidales bacterium]|nr:tRNA-binding protein [Bacteroidales bacterium]
MQTIQWNDFEKVELRVGKIVRAEVFTEARKPAYILHVDFGPEFGIKKSSAQITEHYDVETLPGMLVVGVLNFPSKQIGPIQSECLITGFADENGHVVLSVPDKDVPLGSKLF